MTKGNAPLGTARDADTAMLRAAEPVPFSIVALQRVAYGSKTAEFSIETPIGVIEADLFTPPERAPFVQARSVRDKVTGQWRRTVAFDRDFAARVLEALTAQRLRSKKQHLKDEPGGVVSSAILLEAERRFDAALEEFDSREGAS